MNAKKIFKALIVAFVLAFVTMPVSTTDAQCPMCRMSVESNLKNGGSAGRGLNNGILYLLMMPYLLVGTIGYIWWRQRKRSETDWHLDGFDQP